MINCQQVITPYAELEKHAEAMTRFIIQHGRRPVNIEDFRLMLGKEYRPTCWYKNECGDNVTDTDYGYKDVRALESEELTNMLVAKRMCSSCPLKKHCMAAGLFTAKRTRKSKNKPSLPGSEDAGQAVYVNEFCIYGGLTPGERAIIYHMIIYTLDVLDGVIEMNSNTQYHDFYTTSSRLGGKKRNRHATTADSM